MANDETVVLVADDEPSTLAMLASHLRSRGMTVLEASDGDQAWELAHEHLPHLVVLDVMMPGMSGWEVCRKIREAVSLAHTGVIMLTGIGESLNEMTSPLYGADAHVDKPFEFSVLDARVSETLARRRDSLGPPLGRDEVAEPERAPTRNDDRPTLPAISSRPSGGAKPVVKTKPMAADAGSAGEGKSRDAPAPAAARKAAKARIVSAKAIDRKKAKPVAEAKPAKSKAKSSKKKKTAGKAKVAKPKPGKAKAAKPKAGKAKAAQAKLSPKAKAAVKGKAKAKVKAKAPAKAKTKTKAKAPAKAKAKAKAPAKAKAKSKAKASAAKKSPAKAPKGKASAKAKAPAKKRGR